jgi:LysM repeat protein
MPVYAAGSPTSPGTITVLVSLPLNSDRWLLSIDSIGYSWRTVTLSTTLYTQCGTPKDKYPFGFNGQMKSNDIAGVGNHNTAEFWEYDPRLGRRWNIDPIVKPWESGYASLGNSPIMLNDINGLNAEPTKTHAVKEGETLSSIAKKEGVSVNDIAKWNNVSDPDNINTGQNLIVSDPAKPAAP